jgi:conjugal transfer pilin signal peptidase TrbI
MGTERIMNWLTQTLLMTLAGIMGAVLVNWMTPRPPAVVQVQLQGLVQQFVRQQAQNADYQATTQQRSRQFSRALDASLAEVARRHQAAVVPAGAVITGAPDVTGEVKQQLKRFGQANQQDQHKENG